MIIIITITIITIITIIKTLISGDNCQPSLLSKEWSRANSSNNVKVSFNNNSDQGSMKKYTTHKIHNTTHNTYKF